ncbi:MAG: hypothetical protein PHT97_12610 [Methanoculleus sp.]|uniref:DUF7847 domain-containing protein n=1 Tax=unclassified Methanoculleus TaxID=2619537 RepID=UPI0025D3DC7F|nr:MULTISPECIES: hypothetical protein [unclassified Methanoculleus]MCK9317356.1 hypothetical protein [Methanoculleus sp.]MDD2253058.1 hypothetical protein [Methanoculleus sp.]MDD3216019.1 hypothetical protein [Methanoculleus sp.]MDD4313263.1 hypothetical protein [Methanoculleus sp.]MDD4471986.1 hypothetical protein [Methanoculleus sp.]
MSLNSLKGATGLLRQHSVLWLIGLVMGALAVLDILVPVYGGAFYSEPLALLQVLVVPFLAGGVYGTVKGEAFSIGEFVQSGKTYYFRILLPTMIIFFAAVLTVFLLAVPLALLGAGAAAGMTPLLFGVLVSIVFFTFFYDTVAVFEETTVFESIRRSIEFVMNNLGSVLVFYLANIVVAIVLGLAALFAWTALLVGKLEPLTLMNQTELQTVMPEDILALIGTEGIWITAAVYAVVIAVYSAFLYAYKASFFRNHVADGARMPQGEYDEKGRWYKY